jgi:hypothetical protein
LFRYTQDLLMKRKEKALTVKLFPVSVLWSCQFLFPFCLEFNPKFDE